MDDLLFIPAQHGLSDELAAPPAAAADEIEIALDKVASLLERAGSSLSDVVKLNLFYLGHVGIPEIDLLRRIRRRFAEPPPALTAVPLTHLPVPRSRLQLNGIAARGSGYPGKRATPPDRGPSAQPAKAAFSPAVRVGSLIFVGGQMALGEKGNTLHAGDIVGQAEVTIRHMATVLRALGAGMESVVKLNTYYTGSGTTEDWRRAAKVRSDAFVKPGPGATGVPVVGPYPGGLLLRQDCMAIVGIDGAALPRKTSWPEGLWDWPMPVSFEQGLLIDRMIVLGGQISADVSGRAVHPDDLVAQTAEAMHAVERIMEGFDAEAEDLATLTVFYGTQGDPADLKKVVGVLEKHFAHGVPAFSAIPLARLGLSGTVVEIEGIGFLR